MNHSSARDLLFDLNGKSGWFFIRPSVAGFDSTHDSPDESGISMGIRQAEPPSSRTS
jgi:hypothetical protein